MKKILGIICTFLLVASLVQGAALTAARDTKGATGDRVNIGVYTNTIIYAGAMVAVNSSGYAVNASDATGLQIIGRAAKTVDNQTSANVKGGSGDKTIDIDVGKFYWAGDSGAKSKASIGQIAYVVDNQTISLTNSGTYAVIAGLVVDYDSVSGQVLVDTKSFDAAGASAPASLAVSGNATVGGTFSAVGATTLRTVSAGTVTILTNLTVNANTVMTGTSLHTGAATFATNVVFTQGALAAPAATTNATGTAGLAVRINGTNYVIALHAMP